MKSYKLFAAMALVVAVCLATSAQARQKKAKTMYVFGIATSFNDSTAYFTSIQRLDSVSTYGKTKMLSDKQEYSYQLKNYFDQRGMAHETCVTVNAENRGKLDKAYQKLKQKYAKKMNFTVKSIDDGEFKYERVVQAQ